MKTHYMTGKEDNLMLATKTGCGIKADDIRKDCFVFWSNRAKVDCIECLEKIAKVNKLQGRI